jgi:hypothetical protein
MVRIKINSHLEEKNNLDLKMIYNKKKIKIYEIIAPVASEDSRN